LELIRTSNWFYTPSGEERGYIDPETLKELWFHTGTACNLACPFCLEGSSPGDKRLELITFEDAKPLIDEALELGVEQFSFTGGEPFLVKDLIKILEYAASFRPCLVLTNATLPVHKRIHQLRVLAEQNLPVRFRVSLDYCDADKHDAGRGQGNFALALEGLKKLHEAGFDVSVARQMEQAENSAQVDQAYKSLFKSVQLPEDLTIISFPEFSTPGNPLEVPEVTTHCMTAYQDEDSRKAFMCAFSKMVVKQSGKMEVYACTLVDDDPDYVLGTSLRESMQHRIRMKHHRCYSCFAYGASCSET
jgi:molybdenum cofactor biosynthesis enzyme MoaA